MFHQPVPVSAFFSQRQTQDADNIWLHFSAISLPCPKCYFCAHVVSPVAQSWSQCQFLQLLCVPHLGSGHIATPCIHQHKAALPQRPPQTCRSAERSPDNIPKTDFQVAMIPQCSHKPMTKLLEYFQPPICIPHSYSEYPSEPSCLICLALYWMIVALLWPQVEMASFCSAER